VTDEDIVPGGGFDPLPVTGDKNTQKVVESYQGDVAGHGKSDGLWGGVGGGEAVAVGPLAQLVFLQIFGSYLPDGELYELGGEPSIPGVCPMLSGYPSGCLG